MRGVETGSDGVNHQNHVIMFPPSIQAGRPPMTHPAQLVEMALQDLVTISDQTGDPVIKAQAVVFRKKLKDHQTAWLARAAANEREMIRAFLMAHGFQHAAEAL